MRVAIDPGHGGSDPGAVNLGLSSSPTDDLWESRLTLFVAEDLQNELEARGHEVVMTRTRDDQGLGSSARARIANAANCDLFMSIHCNAAHNKRAHGFEVIYDDARPAHRRVAETIAREFLRAFPELTSRGVKTDAQTPRVHLGSLEAARMPAVLVELGFISNDAEAAWLIDNIRPIAVALADGIEAALGPVGR